MPFTRASSCNLSGSVRLFSAVVDKASLNRPNLFELAFEWLVDRFDLFLDQRYRQDDEVHRRLILFDKSDAELRIQGLAREFKYVGHRYGKTQHYAEVPVFLDSRSSRLVQLADLVAFSLFRFYDYADGQFYDIIKQRFVRESGLVFPSIDQTSAPNASTKLATLLE